MLAAFCFNLSRKLEYFFLATKEFGQDADRAIAQRLKRDRDELARAGRDWRSIAVKEEELMRRIYGEIKDDYEALWATKTGRDTLTRAALTRIEVTPYLEQAMRHFAAIAVLCLVFAAPAVAQTAQGEPPRRFQPPPDHWTTIDSLSQALGLTPRSGRRSQPAYTALNGVMKDAAARRQAIRPADAGLGRLHARAGAHARAARQVRQCARRDAGVSG